MGILSLFNSKTENTTKVSETNIGGTFDTKGTGHGTLTGNENRQVLASSKGMAGSKNHQTNTSGFGAGGSIAGHSNRQDIGRGNAFSGADMSVAKAAGDLSHLGDHSSIGGDFVNKDYQVELVADHGAQISFQQPDTGMSDAIAGLGRALGNTSRAATVQVGDSLKRAQEGDIARQLLYGLGGLLAAYLFLRRG